MYVADILDISGAASEEGKIVELAKGTDKNCKFNVETNIPGANIKYDPPQVGTSEGYKFTTNETLVTVTVGTEGEHVKTVYKFKVKVRTKAEVKLTTLKINNQPLEEDELDEAMNEEGLIIGAKSPCKITWEKDAELFVKVEGNTIQDNTNFPLENTPKTVKITVQDSENNPTETQTYTLVLVKHDAQNIALEDLTINGVKLSQEQLNKATDENTAPEIKINSIEDTEDTEVPLTWKQVAPGVIVRLAVKIGSGYSMGESYFIESDKGSVEIKSKEKLKTSSELIKIAVKTADKSKIYYVKLSYTN